MGSSGVQRASTSNLQSVQEVLLQEGKSVRLAQTEQEKSQAIRSYSVLIEDACSDGAVLEGSLADVPLVEKV